jgi:superfamily II DNA helicase RecQ
MSKIRIFNLKLTPEGFNTKDLDDFVENVKVLNIWEHMLIDQNIWAILIRYEETQYIHPKKSTYTSSSTHPNQSSSSSSNAITYQSEQKSTQYETLTKEEQERFDCLKQWRKAQVQDSSRPAYSVLNDQVLYEISRKNPQTLSELKSIKGMGDSKLSQYGEGLIKTLSPKTPETSPKTPETSPTPPETSPKNPNQNSEDNQ